MGAERAKKGARAAIMVVTLLARVTKTQRNANTIQRKLVVSHFSSNPCISRNYRRDMSRITWSSEKEYVCVLRDLS